MAQHQNAISDAAQAIARAVTESLNRSIATGVVTTGSSRLDGNLRERISSLQSPSHELRSPAPTNRTAEDFATLGRETANVSGERSSISAGTKRRFPPPTLFSRKRAKSAAASNSTKVVSYVRDIICLPREYCYKDKVVIPRGEKRTMLAENGLIGKVQFHSGMSEQEVRTEICSVFAKPMGLECRLEVSGENIFPFEYLQRTGAGSRSLCRPSTSGSFEWNGKQVASLSKSGGFIYILAGRDLPGIHWTLVSL